MTTVNNRPESQTITSDRLSPSQDRSDSAWQTIARESQGKPFSSTEDNRHLGSNHFPDGQVLLAQLKQSESKENEVRQPTENNPRSDARNERDTSVLTPKQLGSSWDEAFRRTSPEPTQAERSTQFNETNRELARAAVDAFSRNGMDGVQKLVIGINSEIPSKRVGPIVNQNGLGLEIHNARMLTEKEFEQLKQEDPKRTDLHETVMSVNGRERTLQMQDLAPPMAVNPFGETRKLTREQQQQVIDAVSQERNTRQQAGKPLSDADSRQVLLAATHAMRNDLPALSRMLPLANNELSSAAQEAFVNSMKNLGLTVNVNGDQARGPNGFRFGEMTISPRGSNEGIRLSHFKEAGSDRDVFSAEAVTLNPKNQVTQRNSNPKDVAERMRAVTEQMRLRPSE